MASAYHSLNDLFKDHSREEVFVAAMRWFQTHDLSVQRQKYKVEHGHYPTLEQGRELWKASKYYLLPQYRPIPDDVARSILTDDAQTNDCDSCREALTKTPLIVPCHHCHKACALSRSDDVVCTDPTCFFFNT